MRRSLIAALAVAGTAAAVHFGDRPREPASAERPAKPQTASPAEFTGEPGRQLLGDARGDLFSLPRTPPAPKKPAPVFVAPEPAAPTFPYRYAGWVNAGGGARHVFLKNGTALPGIRAGEMLDGAWRLDSVSGDRIQVSFVPDGQQLSMPLASLMGDTTAQPGTSPGAVAAGGRPPTDVSASAQPQPASPSSVSPVRRLSPRVAAASVPTPVSPAAGASSPMQPGPVPAGTMPSSPAPTGRLGVEAPGSGSMPTGPAQASGKKLGL